MREDFLETIREEIPMGFSKRIFGEFPNHSLKKFMKKLLFFGKPVKNSVKDFEKKIPEEYSEYLGEFLKKFLQGLLKQSMQDILEDANWKSLVKFLKQSLNKIFE